MDEYGTDRPREGETGASESTPWGAPPADGPPIAPPITPPPGPAPWPPPPGPAPSSGAWQPTGPGSAGSEADTAAQSDPTAPTLPSAPTDTGSWAAPGPGAMPSATWAAATPPGAYGGGGGRRGRVPVVVVGVAALLGGLVGGGVVAAVKDDGSTTVIERPAPDTPARAATQISKPGDIAAILAKVQPAVVRIDVGASSSFGDQGTGTGFIVSSDGVIVTNAHVAGGTSSLDVTLNDGDKVSAKLLGADTNFDLAVVKIDRTDLPTIELGDSDQLQVGDAVIAIGNALGISDGSGPTVTTGIVSGLDRRVEVGQNPAGDFEVLLNAIQTDAAINPGNSGGPLLDTSGRVIGINTAIASPDSSNNVGFAIAISSAKPVIEQLRNGETAKIAFMGVQTQTVTPSLAKSENLAADQGALVTVVEPGTAADKAGVEKGDVIVEVGGSKIIRTQEVARAVRRHSPGDTVDVVVERDGKQTTLRVTLGDASGTQ